MHLGRTGEVGGTGMCYYQAGSSSLEIGEMEC